MTKVLKFTLQKHIGVYAIGAGGAFGALMRFCICSIFESQMIAVLLCNIIGSFVISLAIEMRRKYNKYFANMVSVGFCGGISVFASFSRDSVNALNNGSYFIFFGNLFANFTICVLMAYLAENIIGAILLRRHNRKHRRNLQ